MKAQDKYNEYKKNYPKYIVFIKEGVFYKTYDIDAAMIWNIMSYRLNGDSLSFSSKVSHKVFDTLKDKNISYVIIDNEITKFKGDDKLYDLNNELASIYYIKEKKKQELFAKVDKFVDENPEKVPDFISFLERLSENIDLD